jgi:hypothetical protein
LEKTIGIGVLTMHHQFSGETPQIGTAWMGKHVVVIRCNPTNNQFLSLYHNIGAPIEPPHSTCAETLSRFFSIGYQLISVIPISHTDIQYILVK